MTGASSNDKPTPATAEPASTERRGRYDLARSWRLVSLAGAVIGALSFACAMLLVPKDVASPSQHDLILAGNLGFIFPLLVGFWVGVVRRSLLWIMIGVSVGPVIGSLYKGLCGQQFDWFTVVIGLPCLLSGVTAAALGYGKTSWFSGVLARFIKGLLAGLVLALVYFVILSALCWVLIAAFARPSDFGVDPPIARFHAMMWCAGSVALSIAGGIYLPLFHRCANLHRQE